MDANIADTSVICEQFQVIVQWSVKSVSNGLKLKAVSDNDLPHYYQFYKELDDDVRANGDHDDNQTKRLCTYHRKRNDLSEMEGFKKTFLLPILWLKLYLLKKCFEFVFSLSASKGLVSF